MLTHGSSFSTLYGSKWVATQALNTAKGSPLRFQYPLRVEVGCNLQVCKVFYATAKVSVPSTGRSGLQPSRKYGEDVRLQVSVPSTGRSGLQLGGQSTKAPLSTSFSTLYGSKWVATLLKCVRRLLDRWFQYPLRVEVGCNYE